MPELPEVEVVRTGLAPAVTGSRVLGVEVFEPRSLRRHDPTSGPFDELLTGARIEAAVRRGKFLWMPLDTGRALLAHLGMSGQLLLRTPDAPLVPLLRARIHVSSPAHGDLAVDFVDQRIFGSLAVERMVETGDGAPAGFSGEAGEADAPWRTRLPVPVAHIARDPLDPAFDDRRFLAALATRRTGVKRALLDQNLVSGIGNIYADEALWSARVHYDEPSNVVGPRRSKRVLAAVREVFERALAEGGTSFDAQYVNVNGASGYFAHSLNAYGQQGRPCPRCGTPIVREQFMNRSSHRCPRCQRRPRAAR
ncbi:bifunctional DNA-formamidopyrimidine glycosylase/DNA-(apurinic or apyrimidinic site) lyase [Agromyces mangrovi Wang et al. 2018]|uniref:bifunctional DNA-formamidopyrimidine glycosylase/DNA-(apurinic or apyrimidinic site) lyase n=1 Tax=Agromyces mangrovi TaxID=1858653 RepID=UPI0025727C7B|nr:bifunctional DNA-formamidopyrimidine glycosylase/DNA-(apurinic or apyrimidinic site) lyase [Agromyces mangrovi]BDZ63232.1 formamidopyrimidine-DNA glycosylase [Agromyces mangrovi]